MRSAAFLFLALILNPLAFAQTPSPDEPPRAEVLVPGVKLTEVAVNPDVVTPTGIDVDEAGRIWCVVVHTHFRPENYEGPEHDEVVILSDTDNDGSFETRTVFYNKTTATMDLELGPDGWVYLAERDRVLRVKDTDGDGVGDVEEDIAVLETEADYPHNAMAGIAWHPSGDLCFGLGENYSKPWTMRGTDGTAITGTGEGGVFRCSADGKHLHRIARGFWNPFGLCVREDGEIFAAENDPGARPPCRLLHVVEGGDYGYQRAYGPAAHHPFVCWNGGLRGTMGMIHPTGEAPCAAQPLGGGLLVPTWTDHRLDFYSLKRDGASFDAERIVLVQGGNNFRPVCISPIEINDGKATCYITDWVFVSYQLHKRGRIWKLEIDLDQAAWLKPTAIEPPNQLAKLANQLRSNPGSFEQKSLFELAQHHDPFIMNAALNALSTAAGKWTQEEVQALSVGQRAAAVVALSYHFDDSSQALNEAMKSARSEWIDLLLHDPHPEVVFETLRWISNDQIAEYQDRVVKLSQQSDLSFSLFEACMATLNSLEGHPEDGVRNEKSLISRVLDEKSSPLLRAFALRLIPTVPRVGSDDTKSTFTTYPKELDAEQFRKMLKIGHERLSLEVIAALGGNPLKKGVQELLTGIVENEDQSSRVRAEAIAALASVSDSQKPLLLSLASSEERKIREEALRALRGLQLSSEEQAQLEVIAKRFPESQDLVAAVISPQSLSENRPELKDIVGWQERLHQLAGEADAEAGRRIFFHPRVALCSTCHRHDGRGNIVGPELSQLFDKIDDDKWLLEAILQPSLNVAPEYRSRMLVLTNGKTFTGIHLRTGGGGDTETLRDNRGQERSFPRSDIAMSREVEISLMPQGLPHTLTDRELRDLLAFLKSTRRN